MDLGPTAKSKLCNSSVAHWTQLGIVHDLLCTRVTAKNMATWVEELGCFTVHAHHTLIVLVLIEGRLMWSLKRSWLHIPLLCVSPYLQGTAYQIWGKGKGPLGKDQQNASNSAA